MTVEDHTNYYTTINSLTYCCKVMCMTAGKVNKTDFDSDSEIEES